MIDNIRTFDTDTQNYSSIYVVSIATSCYHAYELLFFQPIRNFSLVGYISRCQTNALLFRGVLFNIKYKAHSETLHNYMYAIYYRSYVTL